MGLLGDVVMIILVISLIGMSFIYFIDPITEETGEPIDITEGESRGFQELIIDFASWVGCGLFGINCPT